MISIINISNAYVQSIFWGILFKKKKKLYMKNFKIKNKDNKIKSLMEDEIRSGTKWGVG